MTFSLFSIVFQLVLIAASNFSLSFLVLPLYLPLAVHCPCSLTFYIGLKASRVSIPLHLTLWQTPSLQFSYTSCTTIEIILQACKVLCTGLGEVGHLVPLLSKASFLLSCNLAHDIFTTIKGSQLLLSPAWGFLVVHIMKKYSCMFENLDF